jgi:hypothetical protein
MNNKIFPFVLAFALNLNFTMAQNCSVLTQRYDNKRIGWNKNENILNTSNVTLSDFGLQFSRPVDDQIYAQPLLFQNLLINGTKQDVVFVATVNNSVYAFNATDSATMQPIWHVNLTSPGARVIRNTDMTGACGGNYLDFSGNMGIVGTPVIDTATSTLFVVSRDLVTSGNKFHQFLHKLDITTGDEKPGSPVYITAKVKGNGEGSVNDTVAFDEQKENQRPALLLYKGVVYVSWASHCDWEPYHGWLIGFDTATMQKKYVYNDTPDGIEGGIWMSGVGPCVDDSGFMYITTGNGTVGKGTDQNNLRNRGESILKMLPSGDSMKIVDFFTPNNYLIMEQDDLDFGIDGPLLIPNSPLSLSGSKEGVLYLLNNDHMGRYSAGNDSVLQVLHITKNHNYPSGFIHGTPVYYKYHAQPDTESVYVWGASDSLTQFIFNRNTNLFDISKTIKGKTPLNSSLPGAMLSVSSKDSAAGTGILWASHPSSGDANQQVRPGTLEAYDARDVRKLLWSSNSGPTWNRIGSFAKFNTPIVANGKVYMATFSKKLNVYGLYKTPLQPVLVEMANIQPGFTIFPNPANESIQLKYFLQGSSFNAMIRIVDLYGRVALNVSLNGEPGENNTTINFENKLKPGVYSVIVKSGSNLIGISKLVKY